MGIWSSPSTYKTWLRWSPSIPTYHPFWVDNLCGIVFIIWFMTPQLTNGYTRIYKSMTKSNFGQLMETWKDQAYLEPGSGSTPACFKNNTLQYSLDNGQVITIILDRLFPDTGFNIQVSWKIKAPSWFWISAFGGVFSYHCLHNNWFIILGFDIWFCEKYRVRNHCQNPHWILISGWLIWVTGHIGSISDFILQQHHLELSLLFAYLIQKLDFNDFILFAQNVLFENRHSRHMAELTMQI